MLCKSEKTKIEALISAHKRKYYLAVIAVDGHHKRTEK